MDKYEIAYNMTQCAIEKNVIKFDTSAANSKEVKEKQNSYNANQLSNFYNNILKTLVPNSK